MSSQTLNTAMQVIGYVTVVFCLIAALTGFGNVALNLIGKLIWKVFETFQLGHVYTRACFVVAQMTPEMKQELSDQVHQAFFDDVEELHRIALHIFTPQELGRMRITIFDTIAVAPGESFHHYHRGRLPEEVIGDLYVTAKRRGVVFPPDTEEEMLRVWESLIDHWRPPYPAQALVDAERLNTDLRNRVDEASSYAGALEGLLQSFLTSCPESPELVPHHHTRMVDEIRDILGLEDVETADLDDEYPDEDFDEQVEHDLDDEDDDSVM